MFLDQGFCHEIGTSHFNTKFLGFIASGHNATVIIAQHHYRLMIEPWFEQSLTGAVKIITVYDCFHACNWLHRMDHESDHSPYGKISELSQVDGFEPIILRYEKSR